MAQIVIANALLLHINGMIHSDAFVQMISPPLSDGDLPIVTIVAGNGIVVVVLAVVAILRERICII
jgi:hypothetical protein